MLHGIIMRKPKVNFKINGRGDILSVVLGILIFIFLLWPPVFAPGVPAGFETGDSLNPIDWSKIDCSKGFLPGLVSTWNTKEFFYKISLKQWNRLLIIGLVIALLLVVVIWFYWMSPEKIHHQA